jgi:DNA replication protein DnaC
MARLAAGLPSRSRLTGRALEERAAALEQEWNARFREYQVPPDYLEVWWDCPRCRDTGWLGPDEKCSCLRQEEIDAAYHLSGLAPEMLQQTFEAFRVDLYPEEARPFMEQVLRECKEFALRVARGLPVDNLVFRGGVGLGKTFLSSAIANTVLQAGRTVIYVTLADLLDLIRRYKFDTDDEDALAMLREADLLILDDLGGEKVSEFSLQELFALVNHRIVHRLPMVVSTNLSWSALEEVYTARIASRLMGSARLVKLDGEDIRLVLKRARG